MKAVAALALIAVPGISSGKDYDIVIYGGTSAAISAAVQAKRVGKSVIVVSLIDISKVNETDFLGELHDRMLMNPSLYDLRGGKCGNKI